MFGIKWILVYLALFSSFAGKSDALFSTNVRLTASQFRFISNECKQRCKTDNYCVYNCIQTVADRIHRIRKTTAPSVANGSSD